LDQTGGFDSRAPSNPKGVAHGQRETEQMSATRCSEEYTMADKADRRTPISRSAQNISFGLKLLILNPLRLSR